ncbi:unnamed protein product [Lactuca saligna]|uniref:Uncharacterized protein n=1 Tax=Lactuca saligna TaxID=75948 RepID=A0AA36EIQ0_LACSI|nr:unnamed protein product [Lactuca saligna]
MTTISELKAEGIGGPLQVRILRKWKHDIRQYETWYLAVDKYADAIQILGQRTNQNFIESVFNVTQCYIISDYSFPELDRYQKTLKVVNPHNSLCNYLQTDFISVLSKIRDCTKANGEPFVLLILSDESGSELTINLWKECITNTQKFDRASLNHLSATTVVAVTNLKPSKSYGVLRHGSSHATRIYVNHNIPETIALVDLTLKANAYVIGIAYNLTPNKTENQIRPAGQNFHSERLNQGISLPKHLVPNNMSNLQRSDFQKRPPMVLQCTWTNRKVCLNSTTPPETPVPTTPAQTLTKRIRSDNETPEASDSARPVVRTLTFTPPGK